MKITELQTELEQGKKCRRSNWGRLFIKLVKGCYFETSEGRATRLSSYDVFADDWEVVE